MPFLILFLWIKCSNRHTLLPLGNWFNKQEKVSLSRWRLLETNQSPKSSPQLQNSDNVSHIYAPVGAYHRTFNSYSASHDSWCTTILWNRIMTAQCEGMGEVGSARYEPALLPPCPSIRALCYSNCQRSTQSRQQSKVYWPPQTRRETSLCNCWLFKAKINSLTSPSSWSFETLNACDIRILNEWFPLGMHGKWYWLDEHAWKDLSTMYEWYCKQCMK